MSNGNDDLHNCMNGKEMRTKQKIKKILWALRLGKKVTKKEYLQPYWMNRRSHYGRESESWALDEEINAYVPSYGKMSVFGNM